jgi:hypothetical protein
LIWPTVQGLESSEIFLALVVAGLVAAALAATVAVVEAGDGLVGARLAVVSGTAVGVAGSVGVGKGVLDGWGVAVRGKVAVSVKVAGGKLGVAVPIPLTVTLSTVGVAFAGITFGKGVLSSPQPATNPGIKTRTTKRSLK